MSRRVTFVALHPKEELLAVGMDNGRLWLWDLAKGGIRTSLDVGDFVARLAFAPDGSLLVAGRLDGKLVPFTGEGARRMEPFDTRHGGLAGLAFKPDGSVLATCGSDGKARLWESAMLAEVAELGKPGLPAATAVTFAKGAVVLALDDGTFIALNEATKESEARGSDFAWGLSAAAASPSGETVIVGGSKGSMFAAAVDAERSWTCPEKWRGTPGRPISVNWIAWAPDGARFLAACSDARTYLVDWARRSVLADFVGEDVYRNGRIDWRPEHIVAAACFARDGRRIFAAQFDGSVRLFDPKRSARKPRLQLQWLGDDAWKLTAHDGATAFSDGTGEKGLWARVWSEPAGA